MRVSPAKTGFSTLRHGHVDRGLASKDDGYLALRTGDQDQAYVGDVGARGTGLNLQAKFLEKGSRVKVGKVLTVIYALASGQL